MKVSELMTRSPRTCSVDDTLSAAARVMWEEDCGCTPVVDASGALVGMLTDRDICMAAYTTGRKLDDVHVIEACAKRVLACGAEDDLERALETMREAQVRRLPVTDGDGMPIGLLSFADILRHEAAEERATSVLRTLAAVCRPRAGHSPVIEKTVAMTAAPRREAESPARSQPSALPQGNPATTAVEADRKMPPGRRRR